MSIRRRKTESRKKGKPTSKKNQAEGKNGESPDEHSTPSDGELSPDETLWQTFSRHPFVRVAPFVLVPYGLYLLFYKLTLQKPELLSTATFGLVNLRPAAGINDERQVLIVGSISGGTAQIASDMRDRLGLEVGHEVSDTAWHFVRDGTVSWFHGIRFLDVPPKEEMGRSMRKICGAGGKTNMGFHPASYRVPEGKCSYRKKWDKCWERECYMTLIKEWGCARRGTCEITFRRNLHQVRNPLRTIESLVAKFCQGGIEGQVSASFLAYASALFPGRDFTSDTCVEAAANFVLGYANAMEAARKRGEIHGTYLIEESTPCDVAELAGFMEVNNTVYGPNRDKVASKCNEVLGSATDLIEHREGKVNEGQVQLGWKDLRGGMHGSKRARGNTDLERKVKDLLKKLGYDASQEPEEVQGGSSLTSIKQSLAAQTLSE